MMKSDILDSLRSYVNGMTLGGELPAGRFFRPRSKFWTALVKLTMIDYPGSQVIDCGCGNGELVQEAYEQEILMLGVDLCTRPDTPAEIKDSLMLADVIELDSWSPKIWPLICRPDHSGWPAVVIEKALKADALAIYVGFNENLKTDLYPEQLGQIVATYIDVGHSGECMYVLKKH